MPVYSNNKNSPWPIRIAAANKQFDDWHSKFKCDTLESYYEGFQWKAAGIPYANFSYNPYTVNLFYSTIKIKLANFLFQRPSFLVTPTPGNADWNYEFAAKSSTIKQDAINAIIRNPSIKFVKHLKLAAIDSFFRFGLVEVGYSADWRNPQQADPLLASWESTEYGSDESASGSKKDKVISQEELPFSEQFYVKRIKPKRFRISAGESSDIDDSEWCGYYEYFYTSVLKKTKGIKFPSEYTNSDYSGNYVTGDMLGSSGSDSDKTDEIRYQLQTGSLTKVWHIFDFVSGNRCLYIDNYWDKPLWEETMHRFPIVDIRWDQTLNGFYPIPPCFNWLAPQDEINEAREQARSYRRRFTRKFQAVVGKVDEEEIEKFVDGPDGIVIRVKELNAISPVANPELGQTSEKALLLAKDDFITVSGTSAEVRKSDRETATKSSIEEQRAKIRESAEQLDFSNFVCEIGREILYQAQEKMSVGLWARISQDSGQELLEDMTVNGPQYQYITNADINDGYDFEIMIDVQNGTPESMAQQEQDFVKFLTILSKFPVVTLSPLLIRKTAYICNFRDEKVIQQMQQAAMLQMAANANAQSIGQSGQTLEQAAPNAVAQNPVLAEKMAQMEPPSPDAIESQLENQVLQ